MFEFESDPVGEPVTKGGAERRSDPNWPKLDSARANQRPDRDQCTPCGNQQRDKGQRLSESERKNNGHRPCLIEADKIDGLLDGCMEIHLEDRTEGAFVSTPAASDTPVR